MRHTNAAFERIGSMVVSSVQCRDFVAIAFAYVRTNERICLHFREN